ncbi:N-acetyltransferase family protein [Aestuariimicrobium sp. p3-SID1156]|uniref:GNAT family N-acetyltransferase n=1 Tax=Aestuariimicrobium sp. p3-SID1156 TaxID=2916038 RepID=UPI00223BC3A8|nr:GNAT family N-acetyltransferase [Aestuariimicrobium sp. p3-SID1156]MCT1459594.1 N-acetyltransferase family protein [Aestuariimicrobium sp. p3-SID1156]
MSPIIRAATTDDLPAITAIYNTAGVATTASYDLSPVTVADRAAWLQAKQRRRFPVLVATEMDSHGDQQVVGFASYGPFRDKAGYDFTVEHSVYVSTEHRAMGVGRMLMSALVDHARGQGIHAMVGVLDAGNEASIAFHEKLGFTESGRLHEVGRKFGTWLDVVLMTMTFPDTSPQR